MSYEILDKISSPSDLKAIDGKNMEPLCDEIRDFLLDNVKRTGGHLASNLGVVELSVALHRVFDSPRDHIIFDVGHQSYVHKMLTGRRDKFDTLRHAGGLSGFTVMRESEHDPFGAGHSSTSISAALGFAEADALSGSDSYTVCVIGDGAYTGGMVHEAINNCRPDLKLVIVLNENGMSISHNKGAFAAYLSRVRASKGYIKAKRRTGSFLDKLPLIGRPIKWLLSLGKNIVKVLFFRPNYFEELGFYYIGPIDGNDYDKVERALEHAKSLEKCVFVHLKTTKGKGFEDAERAPEVYHSVSGVGDGKKTYHEIFADKLLSLADKDEKIVAITPAMGIGTGLDRFGEKYPSRYFDVGIAEAHALTFSAGLSAGGYIPFAAIYSTFLQRGYDSLLHDIALQNLPGIGPYFAKNIISYREKLGGFIETNQLLEVYAFDSARLETIKSHIIIDSIETRKIKINHDDFKTILRHPYIEYEDVKKIINYRESHGMIQNWDTYVEVLQRNDVDERLRWYLQFHN